MTAAQCLNRAARFENAVVKSFSNLCHFVFFGAILLKPVDARFNLRNCLKMRLFSAIRG